MRKVLLLILFLFGIMFLTACKQISQGEISFLIILLIRKNHTLLRM